MRPHSPFRGAGAAALPTLAAALGLASVAGAQGDIVLDGTIGSPSPGQQPALSGTTYLITQDLGAFSGANLFFSFDRFGVPEGLRAFFLGTPTQPRILGARAVIARVTGGSPSEIFGAVNTGNFVIGADFFLLNPQGIFVGPNGSLSVGGSAFLATADRLHWGPDGAEYFAASRDDPGSVLSDTDPVAFGFLAESPAPVGIYRNADSPDLVLTEGGRFGVAAGTVELVGTTLSKNSGVVELAAVRGDPGELLLPLDFAELSVAGRDLGAVRLGVSELRGDPDLPPQVALLLADLPDAPSTLEMGGGAAQDGDAVVIRGESFVVQGGGASVNSLAAAPSVSDYGIDVEVSGALRLEGGAALGVTNAGGVQARDAVRLAAATVALEGDAQVVSENSGSTPGGAILVAAEQEVSVRDGGQIFSQAVGGASAPGGGVTVVASAADGRVLVEGARPADPGDPTSEPRASQISALTDTSDPGGDGGELRVGAPRVEVRDGGQLRTSTSGAGDAGTLQVTAGELVVSGSADVGEASPARAGLFALSRGSGAGGALGIDADQVWIENGARVSASSQSSGPAGRLEITAREVTVRGGPAGAAIVLAEAQGDGDAGDLVVRTDALELLDGGALTATTTSTGDAGDIDVAARSILISGAETGMFAQNSGGGNAGDAGSVSIDVGDSMRVENGGEISVASLENGIAGDVRISGGGDVALSDGASIRATLAGDLRAPAFEGEDLRADVRIEDVHSLSLSDATITTQTFESGDGGDVVVRTSGPVTLDHGSNITARSTSTELDAGNAGSIEIDAGTTLALVRGSRLETSAEGASGGIIRLDAGQLVYLSDARVATNVVEPPPPSPGAEPEAAGDVLLALPTLAVLNRSSIVARARGEGNAGNILIATSGAFFPSDPLSSDIDAAPAGASVLDATAGPAGIAGSIEIVSPAAELVSQVTPLPVEFFDASRLLTTPCEARRARRGSLTVQTRRALEPPPDALFGADSVPDAAPAGECPTT